jgi:hypothetical protein
VNVLFWNKILVVLIVKGVSAHHHKRKLCPKMLPAQVLDQCGLTGSTLGNDAQ